MSDMPATVHLRGITWNHTRGLLPVVAAAQRFEELNPGVHITWEKRSLQEFADQPLAELGAQYDLLVIDHPWAGFAATSGVLTPMEELVSAEFLADQAANSVGPSHQSYRYGDRQWALAIDAATPVASMTIGYRSPPVSCFIASSSEPSPTKRIPLATPMVSRQKSMRD